MFFDIIDRIRSYYPDANIRLVEKAYVLAARAYRKSPSPLKSHFMLHELAVASILAGMHLDEEAIASGILHNILAVNGVTKETIKQHLGDRVATIVEGVDRLNRLNYSKKEEQQAEYLRKMILAVAKDIRVILVKLADRLHRMQMLTERQDLKEVFDPLDLARETLDIYAPLAARLGIEWMKKELENRSLMILNPEEYYAIENALKQTEEERNLYIQRVKEILERVLGENQIEARILGRPKHIYSIYKKIKGQNIDINRVYDLIAFRVIVKSVKDCYEVLSIIHSMWEPLPGRYKDFILRPKPNRYQSLHTTVKGPLGYPMEVQIRTEEMDRIANEGIAAHWLYKEGRPFDPTKVEEIQKYTWLRQILEWKDRLRDPGEVFRSISLDLFPDEVYVFTPQGDIKVLPKGSTPVDFAYLIHTEVGHRCIGARVNGKIVPLKYELQSGDTVEIITSKNQRPSKDWLQFVKTSKARNRIRHWINMAEQEQAIAIGRELCEKEFRKKGVNFNEYVNSPELLEVARAFSLKSVDDLLASVGFKKISPGQVLGRLLPESGQVSTKVEDQSIGEAEVPGRRKEKGDGVRVVGGGSVLTRFARCCTPLPGEPIVGYVTRGRGVSVHRRSCKNIANAEPERLIDVEWDTSSEDLYSASLRLVFANKKGILAGISSTLSQMDAEMRALQVKPLPDGLHEGLITVAVKDQEHLKRVMITLKGERDIYSVERVASEIR
ncbi:GTP pyrophosphokinase [Thermodesulforhabdus norvegica]|uniref:GTP pyrophosphokinase n=2 Tax=Thermodesulforhabdus norvegica TaxID=39841 RepID=A0A1I4TFG6_9BACT|nr:GTP pyrophosphokinase [Thermodesulforhabdus norvegica]